MQNLQTLRIRLLALWRRQSIGHTEADELARKLSNSRYVVRFLHRATQENSYGVLLRSIFQDLAMRPENALRLSEVLPAILRDEEARCIAFHLAMTSVGRPFQIITRLMTQDGVWPMYVTVANMYALSGQQFPPRSLDCGSQRELMDSLAALLAHAIQMRGSWQVHGSLILALGLVAALKSEVAAKAFRDSHVTSLVSDEDLATVSRGMNGREMHSLAHVLLDLLRVGDHRVSQKEKVEQHRERLGLVADILRHGDRTARELRNSHGALHRAGWLEDALFERLIADEGVTEFARKFRAELGRFGNTPQNSLRLFDLGLDEVLSDVQLSAIVIGAHSHRVSTNSLQRLSDSQRLRALAIVPPEVQHWATHC